MEFHEVANLFPLMEGVEFEELKADIAANGLRESGWTYQGKLIDGRNRYRACQELGLDFSTREWDGNGSLVTFVVSLNLHRRHLSSSQRATVAVEALLWLEKEAKKRQGTRTDLRENSQNFQERIPESLSGAQSRDQAANLVGSNGRYVSDAKRLKDEAPDLFRQVKSGQKTIPQAKREMCTQKRRQRREQIIGAISSSNGKSPRLIVARAESMSQVTDESVDLIITSPPYNLGRDNWPMGGDGRIPRQNGIGYDHHRDVMSEDEYREWQVNVLIELYRVAKHGASLFYNHKTRIKDGHLVHPMDWLRDERNPWIIRQEIIWNRGSTHNHNRALFWPYDERIYWMTKGRPALPDKPIGMSTVWEFHGPVASTWHPAPFPPELPKRCIEAVGRDGITVLDPFAGSCTTLKVALEYGYDAIGVDISKEYLERAAKENKWM